MKAVAMFIVAACLTQAPSAWAQSSSREISQAIPLGGDSQMKGFRVPTYDDNNVMTSQIFGETARVLPDGNVEITGLKLEFYSYLGEERITDMTVTSPLCFFNRARGVVVSESDVRISRNEMVVTGKGFRFNNDKQELKILNDSRVVLKNAGRSSKNMEAKKSE